VALGVVALSAAHASQADRAGQVLAVANLQSYLQFVLLFQPKTARVYWQLALLSLGQVAIASTLVPGPLFGMMLLVYVLVGVFTFTLLLLQGESARFTARPLLATAGADIGALLPASGAPLLAGGVAQAPRGLGRGLSEQLLAVGAVSAVVCGLLFFFIPRWDVINREMPINEPLRTVGFTTTITLGELGDVVQNPDVVMRIEFLRGRSGKPFKLADEPLLRGSIVTRYDSGAWTQPRRGTAISLPREAPPPYTRQRITVEPLEGNELFCVLPVHGIQPDGRLKIDMITGQLLRQDDYRSQRMEFEVATKGIVDDRMREFLPARAQSTNRSRLLQMPEGSDGQPDPLAGLKDFASEALRERQVDVSDRVATARALLEELRSSGKFTYSLVAQPRDRELDPLEDFVTLHRSGHCEYFAGALVMMLRSQGIPARMAIGFKGGEWNGLGMYYQVQQLHAHTWVEALFDRDEVPPAAMADFEDTRMSGVWMVLDPTPASTEDDAASQNQTLMARIRQSIDYAQVLWSNYVVGLNSKRQRQGIYEPLEAGVKAAFANVFGRDVWRDRMRYLSNSHVGTFWEWYRKHWFSWRGGLVAVGACLVVAGGYAGARALLAALRRLGLVKGGRSAHEGPTLEMYRRLEAALAARGLQRMPSQTAHEFAVLAGGSLAESLEYRRVAHLPRRIVESFYRVRFGGRALDNRESDAVEHALVELERALAHHR
jgi:transglutaminase-like putative cysteine protease